jgi:hypothetical protein
MPGRGGGAVQRIVFGYHLVNLSTNRPAPDYFKR